MRSALIVLVCIASFCSSLHATNKETETDLYVKRWDVGESFPWIREGSLAYYSIDRKASLSGSVAFYESKKRKTALRLTGSQSAVEEVVLAEKVPVTDKFLREQLPQFLIFTSAQAQSRVLDQQYLIAYNASGLHDKQTTAFLSKACEGPSVLIEANRWALSFFVINNDSTADQWKLSGEVSPFTIHSTAIMTIKRIGEIQPLVAP